MTPPPRPRSPISRSPTRTPKHCSQPGLHSRPSRPRPASYSRGNMIVLDFRGVELAARMQMMQRPESNPIAQHPAVPELAIEQAPATEPPISSSIGRSRDLLELEYHHRISTSIRE